MSAAHSALIAQQLVSGAEPLLLAASHPQNSRAVTSCTPDASHFPAIEAPVEWGGPEGGVYPFSVFRCASRVHENSCILYCVT